MYPELHIHVIATPMFLKKKTPERPKHLIQKPDKQLKIFSGGGMGGNYTLHNIRTMYKPDTKRSCQFYASLSIGIGPLLTIRECACTWTFLRDFL